MLKKLKRKILKDIMKKLTTAEFIEKAEKVHGDRYDYSKSIYTGNKEKIEIICISHGSYFQYAGNHLSHQGCPNCTNNIKFTSEKFIENSKKFHGNKYNYSKVNYINANTKVEIICPTHGSFWQYSKYHQRGGGCNKCGWSKLNCDDFIIRSKKIHNNKYDYNKFDYIDYKFKGIILCPIHGNFKQSPKKHLEGYGCTKCAKELRFLTTEKFINKANKIHNNLYDYSLTNYIRSNKKVKIICSKHGLFFQTSNSHLCGSGCSRCIKVISKFESKFLNFLKIPNTENHRQVKILKKRVDGYDPNTNTIYEYLGDYYHGNPQKFEFKKYNQICHKTFGELYENTIRKFELLKNNGYNIKYIWETDWKKFKDGIDKTPNILTF